MTYDALKKGDYFAFLGHSLMSIWKVRSSYKKNNYISIHRPSDDKDDVYRQGKAYYMKANDEYKLGKAISYLLDKHL